MGIPITPRRNAVKNVSPLLALLMAMSPEKPLTWKQTAVEVMIMAVVMPIVLATVAGIIGLACLAARLAGIG